MDKHAVRSNYITLLNLRNELERGEIENVIASITIPSRREMLIAHLNAAVEGIKEFCPEVFPFSVVTQEGQELTYDI